MVLICMSLKSPTMMTAVLYVFLSPTAYRLQLYRAAAVIYLLSGLSAVFLHLLLLRVFALLLKEEVSAHCTVLLFLKAITDVPVLCVLLFPVPVFFFHPLQTFLVYKKLQLICFRH